MIQRNFGKPGTEPGMQFDPAQVQAGVVDEIMQDWQGLVTQYQQSRPELIGYPNRYKIELDKFLEASRKIPAFKISRDHGYLLQKIDPASVKQYIAKINAEHNVAARTNITKSPAPATT
jgi:hypothetical protein